jgi:hypothetical protein
VLRSKKTSKPVRKVAASALSQAAPKRAAIKQSKK